MGKHHEKLLNNLEVARKSAGLTQQQLSERAEVSRKSINAIENGVYVPSTVLALKIARTLGCRVEDLFSCPPAEALTSMTTTIDHIIIAVSDLAEASAEYSALLGRQPSWRGSHPDYGTANTLFKLDNTYIELLAADGDGMAADIVNGILGERGPCLGGLGVWH